MKSIKYVGSLNNYIQSHSCKTTIQKATIKWQQSSGVCTEDTDSEGKIINSEALQCVFRSDSPQLKLQSIQDTSPRF